MIGRQHMHIGGQIRTSYIGVGVGVDSGGQAIVTAGSQHGFTFFCRIMTFIAPDIVADSQFFSGYPRDHLFAEQIDVIFFFHAFRPAMSAQEGGEDIQRKFFVQFAVYFQHTQFGLHRQAVTALAFQCSGSVHEHIFQTPFCLGL